MEPAEPPTRNFRGEPPPRLAREQVRRGRLCEDRLRSSLLLRDRGARALSIALAGAQSSLEDKATTELLPRACDEKASLGATVAPLGRSRERAHRWRIR